MSTAYKIQWPTMFSGFRGFTWANLPSEISAGITLAALIIPLNIGYAQVAGLPPVFGLYAGIIPLAIFAIFTSSRHVVGSPDAPISAILGAVLIGFAQAGDPLRMHYALALSMMCGLLFFVFWLFRLAFLANFLSRAVLTGFITGLGIEVIFIVTDCLGAYGNVNYTRFVGPDAAAATLGFVDKALAGQDTACQDFDLSPACKSCEHPLAEKADLQIGLLGLDVKKELLLKANTPKGEELLKKLGLPEGTEPAGRKGAVETLVAKRTAYRDRMFQETGDAVKDLTKLTTYFANCVNCYNCRVACPVCYCKECVFVTDVFDHEPDQYLRWAKRKGILKMPTDTVFFHLTRLAHMSTACIGCGQCSNACPNQIPVMELFRTIAHFTQASFEYEAGRSLEEEPPLSVFREKEFIEVTGGKH